MKKYLKTIIIVVAALAVVGVLAWYVRTYTGRQDVTKLLEASEQFSDMTLPSGELVGAVNVDSDRGNKNLVCNIYGSIDHDSEKWIMIGKDAQKADLKAAAEYAKFYADYRGWKDVENIYVCQTVGTSNFVYDMTNDLLYYPENEDVLVEMFEKFETTTIVYLEATEEGRQFLLDNGYGEVVNGQFELISMPYSTKYFISTNKLKTHGDYSLTY